MSDAAKKIAKDGRHTYADYKTWELREGERYELIAGTAYAMSAPNDRHQAISGEIFRQIANYLVGKPCKVRAAPYDVRLFYHEDESDDTVVQPDIAVICDKNKLGNEGCRGAPDLIVEILSPHNSSEEYVRKFNLYLQAGVKEYWIVAPESKTVQVFTLQEGKYLGTACDAASVVSSGILEGFSISLSEVFLQDSGPGV
jgi:Uma2 family endonuclease